MVNWKIQLHKEPQKQELIKYSKLPLNHTITYKMVVR